MRKIINLIEKKLPWGTIGFLLGIISLLVGIYYAVYFEKKAEITFQIISESDILDIRKPLEELSISFEGEDIQKDNLNLRVIRLNVINTGQVDILQGFYAEDKEWGFKINSGKIIEIRKTKSNSKYLKDNITPVQEGNDFVKLQKVILEKEKYVTFEVLVLHNKNNPPTIVPIGKIAGVEEFLLTDTIPEKEDTSFWSDLFYGKMHIHIIRAILYFLIFMITGLLLVFILSKVNDFIDKRAVEKRRKKIERISLSTSNNSSIKAICKLYIEGKFSSLLDLNDLIDKDDETVKRLEKIKIDRIHRSNLNELGFSVPEKHRFYDDFMIDSPTMYIQNSREMQIYSSDLDNILFQFYKNDLLKVEGEKVILDPRIRSALDLIIALIS